MQGKTLAALTVLLALLAGCAKEAPKEVSFETLEDARSQARANALKNAQAYRAENPRFDTFDIVSHGDSSQTNACPQGDGWATVSIMKVVNKQTEKYTVKCSTVSAAIGCYQDFDFQKKPFAQEEGHCQPLNKVPFPLPKIAK